MPKTIMPKTKTQSKPLDPSKPLSKSDFFKAVAEKANASKQDVSFMLDIIAEVCLLELQGKGSVNIPGIVKLKAVKKAARAERQGISPITKQMITFKAKPESLKIRSTPAKTLKDGLVS
jgi:nucleoid DNA-binding protein